jgi:hypothetical protein
MPTLTSIRTFSVVPVSSSVIDTVPRISPGLPGISTFTAAAVGDDQASFCTMLISSPTNFLANDGMPSAACTWSIDTVMPEPDPLIDTDLRSTPWKSQTCSRKSCSPSIA